MLHILTVSLLLFTSSHVTYATWQNMLNTYRTNMGEPTYTLLTKQYQAFTENTAPAIVDERIKRIPIIENNEPLVNIAMANYPRVTVMTEDELPLAHESRDDIDPRSSRHGMVRHEVAQALVRMIDELDALAPLFGYEAGALEVKLFEGLRDLATQKELFDGKMANILAANPTMTEAEAYVETSKWVSPYLHNIPVHSTGAAVDIHLWNNAAQQFCDMGRFNVGGSLAPTFSHDNRLTELQQKNRLLFLIAATRAGLTNYVFEFWHFSVNDRYAAYWREDNAELRYALYSSIQ